jgi:hypothetical protein
MPTPRIGLNNAKNMFRALRPKELRPGSGNFRTAVHRPNSYRMTHANNRRGFRMRRFGRL